jgi:MinD superfamily P-loop ATPase
MLKDARKNRQWFKPTAPVVDKKLTAEVIEKQDVAPPKYDKACHICGGCNDCCSIALVFTGKIYNRTYVVELLRSGKCKSCNRPLSADRSHWVGKEYKKAHGHGL